MDIVRFDNTEEFVRTSVQWLIGAIIENIDRSGSVVIGLAGGRTPKPVYALLATQQRIDWSKVTFFLLDERYVPAEHEDSNQKMIRSTLLNRAAAAKFLAPNTALPLQECVEKYAQALQKMRADIVVIGMGEDGHIASLFPPLDPLAFGPVPVLHTTTGQFAGRDRITVTLPILLHASRRLFLILGEKKTALLQKMQTQNEDASLYPAQYLFDDRSTWMVGR